MLSVRDMRKSFNGFTAVADVSLDVPAQAITAVIGPNGAGKSTLFNLLTGHVRADGGSVCVRGARHHRRGAPCHLPHGHRPLVPAHQHFPQAHRAGERAAALIAHHGQARNFWGRGAALYRDEAMQILESLGLADQADTVSDSLSHGNQKQLELGIALASDPKLLLLDEPTAGMSATETREAIQLLERIVSDRKLTLLFTEHDMEVVFSIAQKIAVLHQGRLIAEGSPAEVRNHAEVRRVYLGGPAVSLLALHDVHAAYGSSRVLFGISLEVAAGRVRVPDGPQRRRQDDDDARHHGPDAANRGTRRLERTGHRRLAAVPHRARRHRLRARGPADLRRAHGAGESRGRGARCRPPGPMDDRYGVRRCSRSSRSWPSGKAATSPAASSRC